MTTPAPIENTDIRRVEGPLLVVAGVDDVGWDEDVEIVLDGNGVRHGVVLERARDLAVIQVLEGTSGIATTGTAVRFSGHPMRIGVGEAWLGRVCSGRGRPLDGGPPILGETFADVNGAPLNPTARDTPNDVILTGISVIDALTTVVRGQEAPDLLGRRVAAPRACNPDRRASRCRRRTVRCRLRGHGHHTCGRRRGPDTLEERSESGELTLLLNTADDPVIERIITPLWP